MPESQRTAQNYGDCDDLRQRFLEFCCGHDIIIGVGDRDCGNLVGGANPCLHLLPVGEGFLDVLRVGDHVGIGDHCSVGSVDDATAQAALGEHGDDRGFDPPDQCGYVHAACRGKAVERVGAAYRPAEPGSVEPHAATKMITTASNRRK